MQLSVFGLFLIAPAVALQNVAVRHRTSVTHARSGSIVAQKVSTTQASPAAAFVLAASVAFAAPMELVAPAAAEEVTIAVSDTTASAPMSDLFPAVDITTFTLADAESAQSRKDSAAADALRAQRVQEAMRKRSDAARLQLEEARMNAEAVDASTKAARTQGTIMSADLRRQEKVIQKTKELEEAKREMAEAQEQAEKEAAKFAIAADSAEAKRASAMADARREVKVRAAEYVRQIQAAKKAN